MGLEPYLVLPNEVTRIDRHSFFQNSSKNNFSKSIKKFFSKNIQIGFLFLIFVVRWNPIKPLLKEKGLKTIFERFSRKVMVRGIVTTLCCCFLFIGGLFSDIVFKVLLKNEF